MGILKRIKNRLPIVGGRPEAPARPSASYKARPSAPAEPPAPPPPLRSGGGAFRTRDARAGTRQMCDACARDARLAPGADEGRAAIDAEVKEHKIILFMKGTARAPQCGFSAAAAAIFQELGVPFETRDVLAEPELRQGIKEYSDWPTIPQIFVGHEFIGGADIVREMADSGELEKLVTEVLQS